MKKLSILSFLFFVVVLSATTVHAQKQNVVKLNPLSLAIGNLSLSYERILNEKMSAQLQAGYWLGGTIGGAKWSGFSFTPEVRFYMSDNERPKGFYLAPFARYQNISAVNKENDARAALTRIGGGAAMGYQFCFGKIVTWDTFLGPQYLSNTVNYNNADSAGQINMGNFDGSFGIRFGTTIGIAF